METGPKRRKKGELTPEQRSAIIYAYKNGISQSKLADNFSCTRKTIYNTLKRFEEHKSIQSLSRTGRPSKLDSRACTFLYLQARRHPFWTYKQLSAATPGHPSRSTIQRVLKQFGLSKRRSKQKIPIKPSLARRRLFFARKWRRESFQSWIFSDECSVQRTSNFGPQWCFRTTLEGLRKDLVNAKVHVKDISQMVWAGIWLGGRTD